MAFYFNNNIPQRIIFNNQEVKKVVYNNTIVWKKLPNDYKEVEYIESNGTQYIDTEIYGTEKTRIDIEYEYNSNATSSIIFGNRIAPKQNEFLLGTSTNSLPGYLFLGYRNSGISNNSTDYKDYNILINKNTKYRVFINSGLYPSPLLKPSLNLILREMYKSVNVNGINYSVPTIDESFDTFKTLDVFGGYTSQDNFSLTSAKLYALKIYNERILQRDFIPCYKVSTNEVGLYDIVSQRFFTNKGEGVFTKGNNV